MRRHMAGPRLRQVSQYKAAATNDSSEQLVKGVDWDTAEQHSALSWRKGEEKRRGEPDLQSLPAKVRPPLSSEL